MRPFVLVTAAALVLGVASHGFSRAGGTTETGASATPPLELVVFEHPDCKYCPAFRSRIGEQYKRSAHAATAPIRYLDVTSPQADAIVLNGPISTVPTAVVMKDGHEVDRIAGLWSPDHFFKMISVILRSTD